MAHIPHNRDLVPNARKLRRQMTPQERHLWYDFLRTYPVKIYRQRVISNFIVDFYCASAKLVIEIDGAQHFETDGIAHDKERTSILQSLGLSVVRYSNREIDCNFDGVCADLDQRIRRRTV